MKLVVEGVKCPRCLREIPIDPERAFKNEAEIFAHVHELIAGHKAACAGRSEEVRA
jgi:hypothetical protein